MAQLSEKYSAILKKLEDGKSLEMGERMDLPGLIKKEGVPEGFKGWGAKVNPVENMADAFLSAAREETRGYNRSNLEFPKDFDKWLMRENGNNKSGKTVFERADELNLVPREMSRWAEDYRDQEQRKAFSVKDIGGRMLAHGLAEAGALPIALREYKNHDVGFRVWDLRDENGRTVADVAVSHPRLGKTYAERIALWELSKLPEGFDQWDAKTITGDTIAHSAARVGRLPKDFDKWDLEHNGQSVKDVYKSALQDLANDKDGFWSVRFPDYMPDDILSMPLGGQFKENLTVAHVAAANGVKIADGYPGWEDKVKGQSAKTIVPDMDWSRKGETVSHCAARSGSLPASFEKWDLRGADGDTVAKRAAEFGRLPENFDKWSMLDAKGDTIAHVAVIAARADVYDEADEFDVTLPADLSDWRAKNASGQNVIEFARENAPAWLSGRVEEAYARAVANEMAASINSPAPAEVAVSQDADLNQWKQKDENGISALQKHMHQLSESGGELSTELSEMATVMPFVIRDPARGRERTVEITKLAHHFPEALSSGFEGWNMRDNNGNTVAHAAARKAGDDGRLVMPSATEHWEMKDGKGRTVVDVMRDEAPPAARARLEEAYAQARPGQFGSIVHGQISQLQGKSEVFRGEIAQAAPQLSYKDAADALKAGTLPADFNDWSKKNEAGWTLAHAAASIGKLPADFKDWDMEGAKPGVTVAHVAMRQGMLPADFNQWGIRGADGKTIGELAVKHPTMGAEYRERIQASNATRQPRTEARSPEPQTAKPAQEAPKLETSSTGRIIGGSRFSRPPELSGRAPEPERREVKAFINRAGL